MIDPITGWFKITQYSDKKAMLIANLVETTWMVWYPQPVEITYDEEGELLGHEFKNRLIENEYGTGLSDEDGALLFPSCAN